MSENTTKIRKIGILTSGGDAPGMNAAVRAVTRYALRRGIEVMGIYEGYKGLINGKNYIKKFDARDVSNIIDKGGTIIYSARCPEFKEKEGIAKAAQTCRDLGIDGLVTIGGDGTFRGAYDLSTMFGIPCIGIPATIDNDITATDYAIGYDTALNTTMQMIDRLRDTCESHARCNVVEVMGNNAGYIAIYSAVAVGATAVAIKERTFDEDAAIKKIIQCREAGKRNFIVVISEGANINAEEFAKKIQAVTADANMEIETKFARFAHVVRGGSPTMRDRVTAAKMGVAAVDLLLDGKTDMFMCERHGRIVGTDIMVATYADRKYKATFDPKMAEKFDPSEGDKFSPEVRAEVDGLVAERIAEIDTMLELSENISNYKIVE
ncbi:MAG: ATP-dependent 6-phosphofructokinase [Eubacteriales bacterium]